MSSFGDGDPRTGMADSLMFEANEALRSGVSERDFIRMLDEVTQYVKDYSPYPETPDLADLKATLREFLDLPDEYSCTAIELVRHQELVNKINEFIAS
jgi:hypothetical protein